jgi:hypothetical protein
MSAKMELWLNGFRFREKRTHNKIYCLYQWMRGEYSLEVLTADKSIAISSTEQITGLKGSTQLDRVRWIFIWLSSVYR